MNDWGGHLNRQLAGSGAVKAREQVFRRCLVFSVGRFHHRSMVEIPKSVVYQRGRLTERSQRIAEKRIGREVAGTYHRPAIVLGGSRQWQQSRQSENCEGERKSVFQNVVLSVDGGKM